jgi:hypothetical protein
LALKGLFILKKGRIFYKKHEIKLKSKGGGVIKVKCYEEKFWAYLSFRGTRRGDLRIAKEITVKK